MKRACGLLSRLGLGAELAAARPGVPAAVRASAAIRADPPRRLLSGAGAGGEARFAGATTTFTNTARVIHAADIDPIPCYRLMDTDGTILNEADDPNLSDETLLHWYKTMIKLNVMDTILYDLQRQGRISFYMTNFGEEATHIGSAAAYDKDDVIYAQYREAGVLLYRGFTLADLLNQNFGNAEGHGKGRQMPVHYGSAKLNFHTISSPLGTQLPQAAGAAYALKGSGNCAISYFGDGSASEGDAHPAFNFAATLECPVIFFCRNNGYAISTPVHEQYRGDGIASRAAGYGMDVIRVDGNDVFAVYKATMLARETAVAENRPVLVEALSYRVSHHSTSDDASAYREDDELNTYRNDSGIGRFALHITNKGLWDSEQEKALQKELRKEIVSEIKKAEGILLPSVDSLFDDVYAEIPDHLHRQKMAMREHMAKYPEEYAESGRMPSV